MEKKKFTELDVEKLNIVDSNGKNQNDAFQSGEYPTSDFRWSRYHAGTQKG
ncbi:hypothetical protein [Salinicoccus roseus]|uniref:hypothetical protein n=1 Tax=Salinicoccus roseus TaxID=45670 RepID=UPI0023016AC5|nr:hypothetical protein [Salinicoccus roseus]